MHTVSNQGHWGFHDKDGDMRRSGKGLFDFLPGLLASADFDLVVDNAKSHSDMYKNLYRRQRLSLLSADLEKLNSSGRFNAICECFQEIHPKPPPHHRQHPCFDRWGPSEKLRAPKKRAAPSFLDDYNDSTKQATRSSAKLADPAAGRPPLLMNACMPQRQESEDPEVLRAVMASANETPRDSDTSSEDEDDIGKLPAALFPPSMPRRQPSLVNNDKPDPEVLKAIMEGVNDSDSDADDNDNALPPRMSMPRRQSLDEMACVLPPCSLVNNAQQPQRQESEDPEVVRAMLMSLSDIGK